MALPFVNEYFPASLTVGMAGQTFFNTVEVTTPQGISDFFNIGPAYGRLRYTFDSSELEIAGSDMLELKEFFIKNRYNSFRLRDPIEFLANGDEFGTGDGSTVSFQLYVEYGSIDKPITKPEDDVNFKIFDNAVEQTEGVDYTVDYTTGIVTFTTAPTNGNSLTWEGEYDIHVRFDMDVLNAQISGLKRGNFTQINLVEEITV